MQMKFCPGNAQHIGGRSEQQDAFGFSDPSDAAFVAHGGVAAVVADGMGGLALGKAAGQTAAHVFLEAYQSKSPSESIAAALLRSLQSANAAVVALAREAGTKVGLGTTLAAAVMSDEGLHWISVGDSRVYMVRDGNVSRITTDHVYAEDLEEQVAKGQTTRSLADTHPERASLTSYLGLEELPKIDRSLNPMSLHAGDWAIVCSDGVYRSLSEQEMIASLRKDPTATCDRIVQQALANGNPAQDNLTVLALKCERHGFGAKLPLGTLTSRKATYLALASALAVAVVAFAWVSTDRFAHQTLPGPVPSQPPPSGPMPLEIRDFEAVRDAGGTKLKWTFGGTGSELCNLSITDVGGKILATGLPAVGQTGVRATMAASTGYIFSAVCGNKTLSEKITVARPQHGSK